MAPVALVPTTIAVSSIPTDPLQRLEILAQSRKRFCPIFKHLVTHSFIPPSIRLSSLLPSVDVTSILFVFLFSTLYKLY